MRKLLPVLLLLIACKPSLNKNVEDAMKQYDNFILRGDMKNLSAMFTTDGELVLTADNSIVGRDSIEDFLSQFAGIKVEEQKSTTDSVRRFGDTAFQYGKYYQRADVNNTKAEIHGMFQANWLITPGGKLMLKRMHAWATSNK
ncbi:MAG: DUF3225 domain-containing protein [Parafilimonas sp.]|nr:DUF3225 domain-containing protein [Parafilimonas sp.]